MKRSNGSCSLRAEVAGWKPQDLPRPGSQESQGGQWEGDKECIRHILPRWTETDQCINDPDHLSTTANLQAHHCCLIHHSCQTVILPRQPHTAIPVPNIRTTKAGKIQLLIVSANRSVMGRWLHVMMMDVRGSGSIMAVLD